MVPGACEPCEFPMDEVGISRGWLYPGGPARAHALGYRTGEPWPGSPWPRRA